MRTDGYQLGAEPAAPEAYERKVIKEKLTEFRRFITGIVAPHAAAHPGGKWVRHICRVADGARPGLLL
ncbi:hypothetical protein Sxan_02780 [Streptomyces xanthophaeus]|uniref:Uncharacterized protein n=1 Tax=Streptomyces xanthophaeus TaxID=67385 RepID=A0A919GWH6_9ACTN|nr:hypothetical protein Sxan_02780 [Streptomyces xanthophaeus]